MATDIRGTFAAWRAKHARPAWKPICVDGRAVGAHFGGSPLLTESERWPVCKGCDQPMQFFLQLALAELPHAFTARGSGVLQLFYCSRDDGDCETWRPFSGTHLVRLLRGPASVGSHPAGLVPFPVRSIRRWSELVDYPHPEEHEKLGLTYKYDFPNNRVSVSCDELGAALRDLDIDADVAETLAVAEMGDKLGGWPSWVQSVEYPDCPQCGRRMELVFQLDSEDNIPHMFGDAGCGHITQCPDHADVLAFGWACS
jgi:hypothetical protein